MTSKFVLQIESSILMLSALAVAIFSRVVTALGVPAIFNFLHFVLYLGVFCLVFPKIRYRVSVEFLLGALVLLGSISFSALINGAGVINVVFDFLLLAEPFLLLIGLTSMGWSHPIIKRFRLWLFLFALIHVIFSLCQGLMGLDVDYVKGVFLNQGNGHHVGGAVALSAAVYFFVDFPSRLLWQRAIFVTACTTVVIFADAKQVVLVFLVSLLILALLKLKNISKAFTYLVLTATAIIAVMWMAATIFPALSYWVKPELITEGLELKLSVFSIITSYYDSPVNWLFGLGPGHTVGRLGLLLPDYVELLQPLGVTTSPVTEVIWDISQAPGSISNAGSGSSMWSLLFSWAGVWGDLGIVGLGAYLYLWLVAWNRLCLDDLSRFLLINPLVFGCIFAWMEEPGYMLFIASFLGLRWQEHLSATKNSSLNSFSIMNFAKAV